MKNKLIYALAGAMVFSAVAFTGFRPSTTSVEELTSSASQAVTFCTPTEKLDCLSPATGNIYTGYKLVSVETQEDQPAQDLEN